MAQVRKRILGLALTAAAWAQPRFLADDPLWVEPPAVPVGEVSAQKINSLKDFLFRSAKPEARPAAAAGAVNTLGEVPDNAWFTNRHGRKPMTVEELRRGPGDGNPPQAPYLVVGAKTDGITPGFRMTDARGRLYFVKPDPVSNPEMATAADVIGSKFFYALGYNTPENYIVHLDRAQLKIKPGTRMTGAGGRVRTMTDKDIDWIFDRVPRRKDGTYRILASLATSGMPVGPFQYEGQRADDPNDLVPHERRRDLRGLHVACAWLNHTDAKGQNSLDVVTTVGGVAQIRHYLIDFGATLGSDSDMAKDARFGHAFVVPRARDALKSMAALGLRVRPWERADFGDDPAIGRLEHQVFDPETWVTNYPNPAFLSRQPEDEYWGAKLVAAFSGADIRAVVSTGQYSDSKTVDSITAALIGRREKILRTYFTKVLALDEFRVEGGQLRFTDLAVKHKAAGARTYEIRWSRFDNRTGNFDLIDGAKGANLPVDAPFLAARIHVPGDDRRTVTVYVRSRAALADVVGLERTW